MKKATLPLLALFFLNYLAISQNVGIGTSNPTRAKLELVGAEDATTAIFGGGSTGISMQQNWAGIGFNTYYNGGNRYIASGIAAKIVLDPSGYLAFDMFSVGGANSLAQGSQRALTLSLQGRVGIAGVVPNALLQFPNTLDAKRIVLWESANNFNEFYGFGIENQSLRYQVSNTGAAHDFYAGNEGGGGGSFLLLSLKGNRQVEFGSGSSRVGINRSDPQYSLDIIEASNGIRRTGILLADPTHSNNSWELFNGGASSVLELRFNDAAKGNFSSSNGSYSSVSDKRLKTNIHKMAPVLDKVNLLEPVDYDMKAQDGLPEKTMGFLAQDVKKQFPELVTVQKDININGKVVPDLHLLNYSGFGVIAIKAIQEQQVMINDQQHEIDELRSELESLKKMMANNSSAH